MPLAIVLVAIGVIFLVGGIKDVSISDLFVGKFTPRNPGGSSPTYVSPDSNQYGIPTKPTGNKMGTGIIGTLGKIIGMPYQGTHSKQINVRGGSDNWQSENAVDIAVPIGTPVYAAETGEVVRAGNLPGNPGGRFAGQRVTVQGSDNAFYYAHLSSVAVKEGQKISAGTLLGFTGEANGVQHLHFAVENGSPLDWLLAHGQK